MDKTTIYEDESICSKCGGFCCKKCGCDYFISDFETINIDCLEGALVSGYTSVISSLHFTRFRDGKLGVNPFLSLRARNRNRGEIDLLSFKTTCASLEENGCRFGTIDRPGGGLALIPKEDMGCYSAIDRVLELKKWQPYQKILQRLVKRYTKMSVDVKLKEDVKNLFLALLSENFEEVSSHELMDVKSMLPFLIEAFPIQYEEAIQSYRKSVPVLVLNQGK